MREVAYAEMRSRRAASPREFQRGVGLEIEPAFCSAINLTLRIAVFRKATDRKLAGDLAGEILGGTQFLHSIAFIMVPMAIVVDGGGGRATIAGFVCMLLQGGAVMAGVLTRRAREKAGGSIDSLPPDDPRRRRFAALHGLAMLVLLLQVAVAGVGLALAG